MAERLLESCGHTVTTRLGRKGKAFVQEKVNTLFSAAKVRPWLVLIDLDSDRRCPGQYRTSVLRSPSPHNLLLRVAVREIEAWLMADRQGLARHLAISASLLPSDPEALADPKAVLLRAALKMSSRARRDFLTDVDGRLREGPGYTEVLGAFVAQSWDLRAARGVSRSLHRALMRLEPG